MAAEAGMLMEWQKKPGRVYERDRLWAALADFIEGSLDGIFMGVVGGRRQQGKNFLPTARRHRNPGTGRSRPSLRELTQGRR